MAVVVVGSKPPLSAAESTQEKKSAQVCRHRGTKTPRNDEAGKKHKNRWAKHHKFYIVQSERNEKRAREHKSSTSRKCNREVWSIKNQSKWFSLILCKNHIKLMNAKLKRINTKSSSALRSRRGDFFGEGDEAYSIDRYTSIHAAASARRNIYRVEKNLVSANKHINIAASIKQTRARGVIFSPSETRKETAKCDDYLLV